MCADLPSLRTEDLDRRARGRSDAAMVRRRRGGHGYDAARSRSGRRPRPTLRSGLGTDATSESGAARPAELASLRRDVDTEDDLEAARDLGVGEHTARALVGRRVRTAVTISVDLRHGQRSGGDRFGHRRFGVESSAR